MFKAEIIGNLGADAEIKEANGHKFVTIRVAHSETWKTEGGETKERTQWIDCTLSNADSGIVPYLKQGVKVFCRGHVSLRVYSSPKLRQMVAGVSVAVQEIELVGGSADAVPRQLIVPETAQIIDVTKHYWCNLDTKSMKKDELRVLVDKRGYEYSVNKNGFVIPSQTNEQAPES